MSRNYVAFFGAKFEIPTTPLPIQMVGGEEFLRIKKTTDTELLGGGLILVAGKVGSGKSTFIASILQHYISKYPIHVVSIEDPVEYILEPQKGYATQKEVGFGTESFQTGLRACMREDPDILFIGEIRDTETTETALTAAESGHLVFGTIHAGSPAGIVDRLMGLAGNSDYVAQRIAQSLKICLHTKRTGGQFQYACVPITDALRNIIARRALIQWNSNAREEIFFYHER